MHTDTYTVIIRNKTTSEKRCLQFLDILLDETLITGTIYIPYKCLNKVSTINSRLPAKQTYEFLLRLALIYPIQITNKIPDQPDSYMIVSSPEIIPSEDGLKTDCYIAALYKEKLIEHDLFNIAITSILDLAGQLNCYMHTVSFLENMLQKQSPYQYFFQGSQPFLIYTGDTTCYSILSVFAECLGTALKNKGYLVKYFDMSEEPHTAIIRYINQSFQAVVGMQTYMFSAQFMNQDFIHDKINGPKYNFVFDHIDSFRNHLEHTPKNLTILTLDLNYVLFAKQHYKVNTRFLPPGGITKPLTGYPRIYDVVFIGSFFNNSEYLVAQLKRYNRPMRFLINRFWLYMRKYPNLPAENILQLALSYYGTNLSDTEFKDLFHHFQHFTIYMSYRYRYQIIKTLIENGIQVNVFGKSWKNSPLCNHPNFIWHNKDLSADECLTIWQQSKLALNIMSWHKNAITERIINSMLQKAAVLTERNPYLEDQFQEGEEILFYNLSQLDTLPGLIRSLLANPGRLSAIGERGYKKALQSHTWECRAEKLLAIIQQDAWNMYQ